MKTVINIRNGYKSYLSRNKIRKVLEDIDKTIYENESVAIMGPSGSGKSTLLNIISGIESLDLGSYQYHLQNIENLDHEVLTKLRREEFAVVNQSYRLMENLTVYENIALGYTINNGSVDDQEINDLCTSMQIEKHLDKYPFQLSGGQMQRVCIARALIKKPKLLLLDEPTANLDYKSTQTTLELILSIKNTKLCVTHSSNVAARFNRILFLHSGHFVAEIWRGENEMIEDYLTRIIETEWRIGEKNEYH